MKVYFHFNIDGFSNCYVVTNEKTMEALIIDPGKITKEILEQIENGPFDLTAVLITHKHKSPRYMQLILKLPPQKKPSLTEMALFMQQDYK